MVSLVCVTIKSIQKLSAGWLARPLVIVLLSFGFVYGFGSEFIFVSYSGSIFAVLLGLAFHEVVPFKRESAQSA